jgi:hypothetical protein
MSRGPHSRRFISIRNPWILLPLLLVTVSGCETLFKHSDGTTTPSSQASANAPDNGVDDGRGEVIAYLNFMDVLDSSDEAAWHAIFQHAASEFQEDPTREPRLRLALVMSRADRRRTGSRLTGTMLVDSRKLFDDSLHDPVPAPPLVRKFARLQLGEIDHRLALYENVRSLRSQLAKAHQASQTAHRDRTEAEARIRYIDAALSEANAKLEAVMNIERDIGPAGKETFP